MEDYPDGPIKFSIIMSAWENWTDLRKSMACIRLQQYQNWELIVVCDGQPTIEAAKIYHKVQKRMGNRRVDIVVADRVEGIWGNRARNIGLDHCRGDYVCWVNHDNVIFPTYLQRHFDNIAGAKEGGEFAPISIVNIDTWVITSRGSHRYCGGIPGRKSPPWRIRSDVHGNSVGSGKKSECFRRADGEDSSRRLADL